MGTVRSAAVMCKSRVLLLTISISVISLLYASPISFAGCAFAGCANDKGKQNYKGEVLPPPCPLVLRDGFYMGLQSGYDMYRFATELPKNGSISDQDHQVGISADPTIFVGGSLLGGFAGFGKQFYWFYNTYLGLEVYGNWSNAQTDASIYTSSIASDLSVHVSEYETDYQLRGNYGIDVLPGIMITPATLLYVRLGYNWVSLNIDESVRKDVNIQHAPSDRPPPVDLETNADVVSGFHYGVGIESAFAENWSLRAEYNHTDLSRISSKGDETTDLSSGSEFSPTDNQFLLSVIYHFYV